MAKAYIDPETLIQNGYELARLNPFENLAERLEYLAHRQQDQLAGIWEPFPKQALATERAAESDELLFGGAAGPGKTEWLMRYGIDQMERYPGNRGVIFRRVFPSLQRSVIPRLQALLATRAVWNENKHTFTFPNGSVLECSSLQYKTTVYDFQGAEYGWIGFEEITEFLQPQWEALLQRLRVPATAAPDCGMRPHACATTNPGGLGHKWVKRRFVDPKPDDLEVGQQKPNPTEIWRPKFDPTVHTEDAPPLRRCFIPATYTDNPALLLKDPGYLSKIRSNSNKGLRRALEFGDWDAVDAVEGALWEAESLENGRCQPMWYQHSVDIMRRVVAVDPSDGDEGGDAYGVAVCARGADGCGYVQESYEWANLSPKSLAAMTLQLAKRVRADAIVVEKNHGGKWLVAVFQGLDPYCNVETVWASDNKRTRAEPVAALFEWTPDIKPPVRARIVGYQPELEAELTGTSFQGNEPSPNILDAMVWGMSALMLGAKTMKASQQMDDQRLAGRR